MANICFSSIIHVVWQRKTVKLYSALKSQLTLFIACVYFFKFWPFTFWSLDPKAFTLHFKQKKYCAFRKIALWRALYKRRDLHCLKSWQLILAKYVIPTVKRPLQKIQSRGEHMLLSSTLHLLSCLILNHHERGDWKHHVERPFVSNGFLF